MPRKLTQAEFIEAALKRHGDKYDYSLVEYVNSRVKVKIQCREHGVYLQSPNEHSVRGDGCPTCACINRGKKRRLGTDVFIKKAIRIHGIKYDYSRVEYINTSSKVSIACNEHGPFLQTVRDHLTGNGCPKCGAERIRESKTKSAEYFIPRFLEIHGNRYDYSLLVYNGSHKKVTIICKEHGAFKTHIHSHLKGRGCQKCSMIGYIEKRSLSQDEFINRSKEVHGDRYGYDRALYKGSYKKVTFVCAVHGEFKQLPRDHMKGRGCSKCGDIKQGETTRHTTSQFIEKALLVHQGTYDYSLVDYKGNKNKVYITCRIHGKFKQSPNDHLGGAGCPKCNASKGEMIIDKFLKSSGFLFEIQKRFEKCRSRYPLPFDFYISSYNLLIEFDGMQHYVPIKAFGGVKALERTQKHDRIKNEFAKKNGIRLLRIPYTDFDRIEEILSEALNMEHQPKQLTLFAA